MEPEEVNSESILSVMCKLTYMCVCMKYVIIEKDCVVSPIYFLILWFEAILMRSGIIF